MRGKSCLHKKLRAFATEAAVVWRARRGACWEQELNRQN